MTRTIAAATRRAAIVRRHHLAGDATTPEQITESVLGLHATDPGSVVLSVFARGRGVGLADLLAAMYDRRTLVRWMAMRRTLFVLPRAFVPTVQSAVSVPLSATLRKRLVSTLTRNGTEPPIEGDVGAWLTSVEDAVQERLRELGSATGAQLSRAEPRLRTAITPRAPSDLPQNVTSQLLAIMGTDGHMVRGTATGAWTTRQHRWEPIEHWWPDGLPAIALADAQRDLVRAWLAAFGPATTADVEWWTGWTKTATRAALARLPIVAVDLDGEPGIVLDDPAQLAELDAAESDPPDACATLLPALDPTPMGWKHREWFFGIDQAPLFDRNGNLGPTIWWNGEIVGGWAFTPTGRIRTAVLADRGTEAVAAIDRAAAELHDRLDGAVVKPVFRTPLERELSAS
jgi:hypothetical protein